MTSHKQPNSSLSFHQPAKKRRLDQDSVHKLWSLISANAKGGYYDQIKALIEKQQAKASVIERLFSHYGGTIMMACVTLNVPIYQNFFLEYAPQDCAKTLLSKTDCQTLRTYFSAQFQIDAKGDNLDLHRSSRRAVFAFLLRADCETVLRFFDDHQHESYMTPNICEDFQAARQTVLTADGFSESDVARGSPPKGVV